MNFLKNGYLKLSRITDKIFCKFLFHRKQRIKWNKNIEIDNY